MENKIWLTSGKYVILEELIDLMFRDKCYAAVIVTQIKCPKQKQLATTAVLSIPKAKQANRNTYYFEEIFHDITCGLFE